MDAMPRLARVAADRIAAGALNGRHVAHLADELGVSQRHLRRALEREIGVSPIELAQTHRLLFAKRLLTDTSLSVTRIAFASGFQSLRRFNAVFRDRYRLSPTDVRRAPHAGGARREANPEHDLVRLTLAYRPPLAWDVLTARLGREAIPGIDMVVGRRYARTAQLGGRRGVVFAEDAAVAGRGKAHVTVDVSTSLLPVLMPLLSRLRRLFDLDAEPAVVDAALARSGLGALVGRCPGVRIASAFDGWEIALRALLCGVARPSTAPGDLARRVMTALGEPIETGTPALATLTPTADRVVDATRLVALGVPRRRAAAIAAVARGIVDGSLRLDPGGDVVETRRALTAIGGVADPLATTIVMRALHWPDAFPACDPAQQRAANEPSARVLRERAEPWRPWRSYAAAHLWLAAETTIPCHRPDKLA
jgi:AraC family transcriptional regulator of adaptative response / DNA-3-methyladenine glycosylase II